MANELQGKKVAFIATEGVEQVELTEPWKAVEQAGAQPELISIEDGKVQAWQHFDKGDTFDVDRTIEEARPDEYDGLVGRHSQCNGLCMAADSKALVTGDPTN